MTNKQILHGRIQYIEVTEEYKQSCFNSDWERTSSYYTEAAIDVLGVVNDNEQIIIAEWFAQQFPRWSKNKANVTVRYHISDVPKTLKELEEDAIKQVMGEVNAEFYHHFTDLTGYLWTDEKVVIGEHNLVEEFHQQFGRYLYLVVETH